MEKQKRSKDTKERVSLENVLLFLKGSSQSRTTDATQKSSWTSMKIEEKERKNIRSHMKQATYKGRQARPQKYKKRSLSHKPQLKRATATAWRNKIYHKTTPSTKRQVFIIHDNWSSSTLKHEKEREKNKKHSLTTPEESKVSQTMNDTNEQQQRVACTGIITQHRQPTGFLDGCTTAT